MNHFPSRIRVAFSATLLASLLLGSASSIIPHASAATNWCGSWQGVPTPSPGPTYNTLWGIAASSKADIWAVGGSGIPTPNGYPLNSAVVEHWDGARWSIIPSPQPGNYQNYLLGVAALSSSNAWAVGLEQDFKPKYEEQEKTLIEHWDGIRWSIVPSPNANAFFNVLNGMVALSANDIWAVGDDTSLQGYEKTLIEHWDGTRWSIIASPNAGVIINELQAVTAFSPGDIWAVGKDSNKNYGGRTLIEHWNGKQWSIVASPSVGNYENGLWSVAGVAPHDLWAVGYNWAQPGDVLDALIEHWDGSKWSVVSSPNPPGGDNFLHGVAALTTNDVWAVGGAAYRPFIEHWDGRQWNVIANQGQSYWFLNRIAAPRQHDLWAVGGAFTKMLTMHDC